MCVIDPSYLALRGSIRDDDVRGHLPLLLLLLLLMICSRLLGSARRACRWRERCTRVVWGSKGVRGVGGKHGGGGEQASCTAATAAAAAVHPQPNFHRHSPALSAGLGGPLLWLRVFKPTVLPIKLAACLSGVLRRPSRPLPRAGVVPSCCCCCCCCAMIDLLKLFLFLALPLVLCVCFQDAAMLAIDTRSKHLKLRSRCCSPS